MSLAEALEKPLPKPERRLLDYASARALEALLEALPALELLERGFTRNAAGKALQALRALTGAPLALEKDKILERPEIREQSRWLEEVDIPRVPNTRLKALGGSLKVLQVFRTMARSPMEFLISTTIALRFLA